MRLVTPRFAQAPRDLVASCPFCQLVSWALAAPRAAAPHRAALASSLFGRTRDSSPKRSRSRSGLASAPCWVRLAGRLPPLAGLRFLFWPSHRSPRANVRSRQPGRSARACRLPSLPASPPAPQPPGHNLSGSDRRLLASVGGWFARAPCQDFPCCASLRAGPLLLVSASLLCASACFRSLLPRLPLRANDTHRLSPLLGSVLDSCCLGAHRSPMLRFQASFRMLASSLARAASPTATATPALSRPSTPLPHRSRLRSASSVFRCRITQV